MMTKRRRKPPEPRVYYTYDRHGDLVELPGPVPTQMPPLQPQLFDHPSSTAISSRQT